MRIVSVCYREEKTHNREIAVQLVRVCYREKTLRRVQKKNNYFFLPERPNNSLLDMTPRNDRFK